MIVALLGGAGAGKTTVAKAMELYVKDSFIIDGDELRAETLNLDIGLTGREANIHLGYARARRLSDLGFTVFIAMQAPIKEIREQYLNEHDIEIIMVNNGDNPKDDKGYNDNFYPDYSGVIDFQSLQEFEPSKFYDAFFPKVIVPSRLQGFHKGHKVVLEEAKRISPNVTIGLRVDDGDIIDLDANIKLLESKGYKVVKTPNIEDDWTTFANEYDIYVQGNPMVIERFETSTCKLHHVPRYGDVSGTDIRNKIKNKSDVLNSVDEDVVKLIEEYV